MSSAIAARWIIARGRAETPSPAFEKWRRGAGERRSISREPNANCRQEILEAAPLPLPSPHASLWGEGDRHPLFVRMVALGLRSRIRGRGRERGRGRWV